MLFTTGYNISFKGLLVALRDVVQLHLKEEKQSVNLACKSIGFFGFSFTRREEKRRAEIRLRFTGYRLCQLDLNF